MEKVEKAATPFGAQPCLYPHCGISVPLNFYGLHLNTCRRQWRGPIITCPFNNTHMYGEPERLFHLHLCPDKADDPNKGISYSGRAVNMKDKNPENNHFAVNGKKEDEFKVKTVNIKKREAPAFNTPEDLRLQERK